MERTDGLIPSKLYVWLMLTFHVYFFHRPPADWDGIFDTTKEYPTACPQVREDVMLNFIAWQLY